MESDIKILDRFEILLRRPYMYTVGGAFLEAISYMEGCRDSLAHVHFDGSSTYIEAVRRYGLFSDWLSEKFGRSGKEVFVSLNNENDKPLDVALALYQEFKAGMSDA